MPTLIEQLRASESDARAIAIRLYVELIDKNSGAPEDVAEMQNLMVKLGKTTDDLQVDAVQLYRANDAASRALRGNNLSEQSQAIDRKVTLGFSKMEEGIEKLRGEYKQLLIEHNQMSELRRSSRDAAINLQKLRQQSPELLGHLPKFDTSNM